MNDTDLRTEFDILNIKMKLYRLAATNQLRFRDEGASFGFERAIETARMVTSSTGVSSIEQDAMHEFIAEACPILEKYDNP
jgi:hypothetical protein